jgi:hypothetical protein
MNVCETEDSQVMKKSLVDLFSTVIPSDSEDFTFKVFERVMEHKPSLDECVNSYWYQQLSSFAEDLLKSHSEVLNKYLTSGKLWDNQLFPFKLFFITDYLFRSEINKVELDEQEKLLKAALEEFKYYQLFIHMITVSTDNLFRISGSALYRTMLNHFDEKIKGEAKTGVVLLSSHDANLSSLAHPLMIVGKDYDFNDEFTFLLNQHEDGEFYVIIEYNGEKVPISFENHHYGDCIKYSCLKKYLSGKINNHKDVLSFINGEIQYLKDFEYIDC